MSEDPYKLAESELQEMILKVTIAFFEGTLSRRRFEEALQYRACSVTERLVCRLLGREPLTREEIDALGEMQVVALDEVNAWFRYACYICDLAEETGQSPLELLETLPD